MHWSSSTFWSYTCWTCITKKGKYFNHYSDENYLECSVTDVWPGLLNKNVPVQCAMCGVPQHSYFNIIYITNQESIYIFLIPDSHLDIDVPVPLRQLPAHGHFYGVVCGFHRFFHQTLHQPHRLYDTVYLFETRNPYCKESDESFISQWLTLTLLVPEKQHNDKDEYEFIPPGGRYVAYL